MRERASYLEAGERIVRVAFRLLLSLLAPHTALQYLIGKWGEVGVELVVPPEWNKHWAPFTVLSDLKCHLHSGPDPYVYEYLLLPFLSIPLPACQPVSISIALQNISLFLFWKYRTRERITWPTPMYLSTEMCKYWHSACVLQICLLY